MAGVPKLDRDYIERKVEEVVLWFNPKHFDEPRLTPIVELVAKLADEHGVELRLTQDLGTSNRGKKILGACIFRPPTLLLDRVLDPNGPRYRFTLAHELGHLVLHRSLKLDWESLDKRPNEVSDSNTDLHTRRRRPETPRQWLEWQANAFASALLLPRATVRDAIAAKQTELGITRNLGTVFVDNQWHNVKAYHDILAGLQLVYQASKTMVLLRLKRLRLLTDWRDFNTRHVSTLFSEEPDA